MGLGQAVFEFDPCGGFHAAFFSQQQHKNRVADSDLVTMISSLSFIETPLRKVPFRLSRSRILNVSPHESAGNDGGIGKDH